MHVVMNVSPTLTSLLCQLYNPLLLQLEWKQQPCATPVRGGSSNTDTDTDVNKSGIAANSSISSRHNSSNQQQQQQHHNTIVTPGQTSRRYVYIKYIYIYRCVFYSLRFTLSCAVHANMLVDVYVCTLMTDTVLYHDVPAANA
jgi:hypothetical protein